MRYGYFKFYYQILAGFLLCSFSAQSTIVKISSLAQMAYKSDIIIHAKVTNQSVKESKSGRLNTTTELKVVEAFKGAKNGDIKTIYQVGGELNDLVQKVVGAQNYVQGEELILFGLNFGDMLVSYGTGLGKFKVLRDKKKALVVEDLHDLIEVKYDDRNQPYYGAPQPRSYPSLAEFKNQLSEILHAPKYRVIKTKPFILIPKV